MKLRTIRNLGGIFLILGGAFYFYFIHRSIKEQTAEGWHSVFSYQRFHCPVCLGRVEELTFKNQPISPPQWTWIDRSGSTPRICILTPVGEYQIFKGEHFWRLPLGHLSVKDVEDNMTPGERAQGWYDAVIHHEKEAQPPWSELLQKKGTPPEWCLLATSNAARWIEPTKIPLLGW